MARSTLKARDCERYSQWTRIEVRPESLTAANLFSAFAYHFFYSHSILSTLLYHTLLFYTYSLTLEYIHRLDTDNDARLFSRNQNRSLISVVPLSNP